MGRRSSSVSFQSRDEWRWWAEATISSLRTRVLSRISDTSRMRMPGTHRKKRRRSWATISVQETACPVHSQRQRMGTSDQISLFLAKALPEWDFKYLSNSNALYLSGNAEYHSRIQGANFAVWLDLPALWSASRCLRSEVDPVYCCSGKSTLWRM